MTISDFSRDAVCRYLRSVVWIDDAIFDAQKVAYDDETLRLDGVPTLVLNGENASSDVAPYLDVSGGNAHGGGTLQLNDDNLLDARAVTDGFARIGVICGVYQPTSYPADDFQNENFQTLLNVCKHADVFILDWNLFKDNASAVPQLLCYLENEDAEGRAPQPVRFCVIYTKANVPTVYAQVYKTLNGQDPEEHPTNKLYLIRKNNLTVVIYGREVASCHVDESQVVSPGGLANRIIQDYSKTYEGILPALALRGIASIRENIKRILDKFPATMDPALVLHGGLTVADHSVADDMTLLLADEIRAVLEDDNLEDAELYPMLAEKVELCKPDVFNDLAADKELVDSGVTPEDLKSFVVDLLRNICVPTSRPFLDYKDVDCKLRHVSKKLLSRLRDLVVLAAGSEKYRAGDLSKLFCQRTIYGPNRILKFGTVVKQLGVADVYYLCVMPLCDCGRLHKANVNFPFWKLYNAAKHDEGKANGIIVQGEGGQEIILCVKGKIKSNLSLHKFKANDVVRFVEKDKHFVVEEALPNGKTKEYEWIAELKPLHVQRMSEHVGREFSHVGLTESEWLRLQVDR